ncbi:MAG: isopentenyl phosphate kinase [Halobacteriota archaeon]
MVTVLKLGGSVITDKQTPETIDEPALSAAADSIATAIATGRSLVLVHGGGSFGHVHAAAADISTTSGSRDVDGAFAVHEAMTRLNREVLEALHERSVPALPVHPLSFARRSAGGTLTLSTAGIEGLLEEGFLPVVHGDVIAHEGEGVTVLSGDEIVTSIADDLGADRVGICSTVPGVLDDSGAVIESIDSFEAVAPYVGASETTDVSGGMAGKVSELVDLGAPAFVFGPDDLGSFLDGDAPGTRIDG